MQVIEFMKNYQAVLYAGLLGTVYTKEYEHTYTYMQCNIELCTIITCYDIVFTSCSTDVQEIYKFLVE